MITTEDDMTISKRTSKPNVRRRGDTYTWYAYVTAGDGTRRLISRGGFRTIADAEADRIASSPTCAKATTSLPTASRSAPSSSTNGSPPAAMTSRTAPGTSTSRRSACTSSPNSAPSPSRSSPRSTSTTCTGSSEKAAARNPPLHATIPPPPSSGWSSSRPPGSARSDRRPTPSRGPCQRGRTHKPRRRRHPPPTSQHTARHRAC